MGDRSLLMTAERLFEAMGLPIGEAHVHRFVSPYEKGWILRRSYIDDDGKAATEDITSLHKTRHSLWQAMKDATHLLNKVAAGISRDMT